ncbi:METTL7A [Scenedesmus sp. PABB004]|nr:METTL7A [Scenedesmus sp. PABB004]
MQLSAPRHVPARPHRPAQLSAPRRRDARAAAAAPAAAALGRRAVLGLAAAPCCCAGCGRRWAWYDSWFALNMAAGMADYEHAVAPLKAALFERLLRGARADSAADVPLQLLEVGIGTGPNLRHLRHLGGSVAVTGLEPNPAMWPYAREAAAAAGLGEQQLALVAGDATALPFEAGRFDVAVITLVLCSLPGEGPRRALDEVLRVLRPGGQLLVVEHVAAPELGWLRAQQALLDPLQQLLADGCHLTRRTDALLRSSGFGPSSAGGGGAAVPQTRVDGVAGATAAVAGGGPAGEGLLAFEVEGMGLIAPHVAGVLRAPLT